MLVALAVACGPSAEPAAGPPSPPAADRELWGARLEVRGRGSTVVISAPYVQEFVEAGATRADSGVTIDFHDSSGALVTQVRAQRLSLTFSADLVSIAGDVRLRAGDSLAIAADSLIWYPDEDVLAVPGALRLELPQGSLHGRDLRTGPGVERWEAAEPRTRWRGGDGDGAYLIEVAAARAAGRTSGGRVVARYDSVRGSFEGRSLRGAVGRYEGGAGGGIELAGEAVVEDSTWVLWADTVRYDLEGRAAAARGHVRLRDGSLGLEGDSLGEAGWGRGWVVQGQPARLRDGDRTLASPVLTFDRHSGTLSARAAMLSEADRVLTADTVTYERAAAVARASGEVRLEVAAFDGVAGAQQAAFDMGRSRVVLTGRPALRRTGAAGELAIAADTLTMDLEGRQLSGSPGFSLASPSVRVEAARGLYDGRTEVASLSGGVELVQTAGQGARLRADSMVVHLAGGDLSRVEAPTAVTGTVGREATQVTWLSAGGGVVHLADDRLTTIELEGTAEVTHRSAGRGKISRFEARSMTLTFGPDEALASVRAQGEARMTARLPPDRAGEAGRAVTPEAAEGAYNRVAGEALEILLDHGDVVEVRLLESVEGRYLSPGDIGPDAPPP
ncbi:MAG: hypothetical protein ABIL09_15380 [Gemmatimonadota bacterium]